MVIQERLKEVLDYNPETGEFRWKKRTSILSSVKIGSLAGTITPQGHRYIRVDGEGYYAARLAWLYMTGEWPKGEIDHVNRKRADDRFANLRDVTRAQNHYNRTPARSWLPQGVYFSRGNRSGYEAKIRINGKSTYLGYFNSATEASAVYEAAKAKAFEDAS